MTTRSWVRRAWLGAACLASVASPPAGPETFQAPRWQGEAYLGPTLGSVSASTPLEVQVNAALTIPASGSGASTSALRLRVDMRGATTSTLHATLVDGDGAVLAEDDSSGNFGEGDSDAGVVEVRATDVLAACVAGTPCTAPLGFQVTADGEPVEVYWELWLTVRDVEVGPEEVWIDVQLNPASG